MKITRIIALAMITGASGAAGIEAQTLRDTSPPAETPPASFEGKQYVDSRGCVYIRAGIDGNVAWVPRVTRSRKQICGFEPTRVAGSLPQAQPAAPAQPVLITLEPSQRPARSEAAAPAAAAGTAAPAPRTVQAAPRTQPPQAAAASGPAYASGASAVQYDDFWSPGVRVVQQHIYQDRRLSNSFAVPDGYRPVWSDGRLNPHRAERTIRPAVVTGYTVTPAGYQAVERHDGRMNPLRSIRTPEGDAQMAQVWTSQVPQRLVGLPLDRPVISLPREVRRSPAESRQTALRLSTRSAPDAAAPEQAAAPRRYVRAATFQDAAQAQAAARKLAAAGLPVRLGTVSRKGQPYKVVLAGPFGDGKQAAAALARARNAGFAGAKLSK